MEHLGSILPATVIAAIVLFILKELVEWWRRWRANARRRNAFRILLARECELNYWALTRLKDALSSIADGPLDDYSIDRRSSGQIRFNMGDSDGGASWPLPPIRSEQMNKIILDVATLDKRLFASLENAFDAAIDLDHARQSLIDNIEQKNVQHREALVDYGLEELEDVLVALKDLYKACTGTREIISRVR